MRALIVSGGEVIDKLKLKEISMLSDFIIAADSGYEHLSEISAVPDIFIGDMDSVKTSVSAKEIIKLNTDKDETDTEAAVRLALSKGYNDIIIFGGIGTRADHTTANLFLLKQIYDNDAIGCIINEHNEIYYTESEFSYEGNSGDTISIVPVTDCENIVTTGLLYELNGDTLIFGTGRGVSNVLTDTKCMIKIGKGKALIFKSLD